MESPPGHANFGIGTLVRRGPARHAFGRTAPVPSSPITAGDFGIDPAQHHAAAVERNNLAILRTAGRTGRADKIHAAWTTFQMEFLQLRAVGEVHHDAAGRSAI